jgi:hypothetical protein
VIVIVVVIVIGVENDYDNDNDNEQIRLRDFRRRALVLRLLSADAVPDLSRVAAHHRDKIPSCPTMLTHEVPPTLGVGSRNVDCAFALDVTDHLRTAYFGGIAINMCT